jgi:hypothetical protein
MAITIPTTGIGDTTPAVATENIGGVHYQLLKLYTGTTGTATVWDGGVSVSAVTPGTTTNALGKMLGTDITTNAVGVLLLGKHEDEASLTSVSTGQYAYLSLSELSELRTRDQRAFDLQKCNDATLWTALNDDTANIVNSTNHVFGTGAISFDKVNGTANTVYACITDTISALNVGEVFEAGGFVGLAMYLPDITNVTNVFLRLGTDGSNYNQWTWPVADLTAGTWLSLRTEASIPDHANNAGNGWNPSAVTFVSVGVTFAGETNTLAGILVDHVYAVGGRVTSSDISSNISISTPNVNLARVANSPTGIAGNGVVGAGTQRVTIASDSTGVVGVTTGNISADVRNLTTGNVVVRNITTGYVAAALTNWTTQSIITTGSLSAIVANWPSTQTVTGNVNVLNFPNPNIVTGYVVITTGQVSIPNVVNVTGSLAATFASTAFQVTTGNINIGNVVNVTGSLSATFDSTSMIVNSITTGYVAAWVVNTVPITGTFSATLATTDSSIVNFPATYGVNVLNWTTSTYVTTGSLMVGQLTTARSVISLTTGNVSADVRNITTGNVAVASLTTGNISADVRNVTTGNVVVTNLLAGTLTTGNISAQVRSITTGSMVVTNLNTGAVVVSLTTGNVSADVRNVTTGTIHTIPYGDRANYVYGITTNLANTTIGVVITSQGASVGTYLTQLLVTCNHATTGTVVAIMNGATTAVRGYAAAGGGGWAASYPAPLAGGANVPWSALCETSGSSVIVSMSGYKGVA